MQYNYASRYAKALEGLITGIGQGLIVPVRNMTGYVKEVWTIGIPATPNANTEYTVTISDIYYSSNPQTVSYTTDATPTQAELQSGLRNAMRSSPVFNGIVEITLSGANIQLTHRKAGVALSVAVNNPTTPLTATQTVPASNPTFIDFGLAITRTAIDSNDRAAVGRLPQAGDTIFGFTVLTQHSQKSDVGSFADPNRNIRSGYAPLDTMNVLHRCNDLQGIWLPTVETSINPTDGVYVSVAASTVGMIQKTSAGSAIDISAYAKYMSGVEKSVNGKNCVLVHYNF